MARGQDWTYEETLAALALYVVLEPRERDKSNEKVIALAESLGRSVGAVVYKMGNIEAKDPKRIRTGFSNGSKIDAQIWTEYEQVGDELFVRAKRAYERVTGIEDMTEGSDMGLEEILREGGEKSVTAKARLGQSYFRNTLLKNYDNRCCLTGIEMPKLLMASHIKPWRVSDAQEKVAPSNGLLLNAFHDKAFDQGFITLNRNLEVVVSRKVKRREPESEWLWRFNGVGIVLPEGMPPELRPSEDCLEYHRDVVFLG